MLLYIVLQTHSNTLAMKYRSRSTQRAPRCDDSSYSRTHRGRGQNYRKRHYHLTTDAQRSCFLTEVLSNELTLRQVRFGFLKATIGGHQVEDQLQYGEEHRQGVPPRRPSQEESQHAKRHTHSSGIHPSHRASTANRPSPPLSEGGTAPVGSLPEPTQGRFLGGAANYAPALITPLTY